MAEERQPNPPEEGDDDQEPKEQKPRRLLWRLLTPRLLLLLLGLSLVGHAIGLTYSWLRAMGPAVELSPEVSLGEFRFEADPQEAAGVVGAEFRLHIALLEQVESAARRALADKRLRVEQAVEELVRRAHGGDFDDPQLAGLKQELQEQINEALGIRVIDDVIITDLRVERSPRAAKTLAEIADTVPWEEEPAGQSPLPGAVDSDRKHDGA